MTVAPEPRQRRAATSTTTAAPDRSRTIGVAIAASHKSHVVPNANLMIQMPIEQMNSRNPVQAPRAAATCP